MDRNDRNAQPLGCAGLSLICKLLGKTAKMLALQVDFLA